MDLLALRHAMIEEGTFPTVVLRHTAPAPASPSAPPAAPRRAATTSWASAQEAARARTLMAAKGSTPEGIAWFLDGDE